MGCHPAPSNKYSAPCWVTKKSAAWVNLASAQTGSEVSTKSGAIHAQVAFTPPVAEQLAGAA